MKIVVGALTGAALLCAPVNAIAGPKHVLQPVQIGAETVRYEQGVFTLDLRGKKGVVQLRPLPADHGNASFSVAVFNDGLDAANIDISNIKIEGASVPVRLLSKEDMVKKAQSRATWAAVAVALAGAAAATAAASQRDHYSSTLVTRHGTYRSHFSAPSVAGQIQAAALTAGTGVALSRIQGQLDQTREVLGEDMVQLTTVDPGDSYAGRIFLTRYKVKALPTDIRITVRFNGEDYPFMVRHAKKGTPMPEFKRVDPLTEPAGISQTTEAAPAAVAITPAT